ncbi:MAG: hypothetical protein WCB04_15670 [Mycobacteriales bacterium]
MADPTAVCARCARTEPDPPPTWSLQTEGGRRSWLCEDCTRDNLRSIEAKLDEPWW